MARLRKVRPFHVVFVVACLACFLHLVVFLLPALALLEASELDFNEVNTQHGSLGYLYKHLYDNELDLSESGAEEFEEFRALLGDSSDSSEDIGPPGSLYSSEDDSSIGDSSDEELLMKMRSSLRRRTSQTLVSVGLWYGYTCTKVGTGNQNCEYHTVNKALKIIDASPYYKNDYFGSTWNTLRLEISIGFILCLLGLAAIFYEVRKKQKKTSINPIFVAIIVMVVSAILTLVPIGRIILLSWERLKLDNETNERENGDPVFYIGWGVALSVSSAVLSILITLSSAMIYWTEKVNRRIRQRLSLQRYRTRLNPNRTE